MYSNVPPGTPLGCLLENLKSLKLMPDMKASKLTYLYNKVWIQYQLHNSSKWPLNGTLDLTFKGILIYSVSKLANEKGYLY